MKKSETYDIEDKKLLAFDIDRILTEHFGEPEKFIQTNPVDQLILTVLSQSTSDHNRDLAFSKLKRRFTTWEEVHHSTPDKIADAIRSGGLADQKAQRILDILDWLKQEKGGYTLDWIAEISPADAVLELTALKGIGVKTAAVLLCFSFDVDIFPVDVHVHRICRRLGFVPDKASAEKTHQLMQNIFPPGRAKSLHLNMLKLGRTLCRPSNPDCVNCPLKKLCQYNLNNYNNRH